MTKKVKHAVNFLVLNENDFKKITKTQKDNFLKLFNVATEEKHTCQEVFDKNMFFFMSFDKKDSDCVLFSMGICAEDNITFFDIFLNDQSYSNTTDALWEALGFAYEKSMECGVYFSIAFPNANTTFWDIFFKDMVKETPDVQDCGGGVKKYTVSRKSKFEKRVDECLKHYNIAGTMIKMD